MWEMWRSHSSILRLKSPGRSFFPNGANRTSSRTASAIPVLMVNADSRHHPAQIDHVEWCSAFDADARTTTETRRKVFDQAEDDGLITAFCHFPDPFGKLVPLQGKRVFQAL